LGIKITIRSKLIDLDEYQPSDVNIDDIAHSLSQQCRYNGNTPVFYSVAEHSVYVARAAAVKMHDAWNPRPDEDCCLVVLGAVLHDAPEHITGDVVRPIKRIIENFDPIERKATLVSEKAFAIDTLKPSDHSIIKECDDYIADLEQRVFFPWKYVNKPPAARTLSDFAYGTPGLLPADAKKLFLETFHQVSAGEWWPL
jgi:5'-deoxynucleotidase YfbR-like HD superfamily hydrolase